MGWVVYVAHTGTQKTHRKFHTANLKRRNKLEAWSNTKLFPNEPAYDVNPILLA
jgi:hypothetical protein